MRLTATEVKIIKESIFKYIKNAKIILFGSRIDDNKKGGDIDICIETNQKVSLEKQIKILAEIEINGVIRKVDLVLKTPNNKNDNIFKTIDNEGIII